MTDDNDWTFPPAVMESDAIAIPHTRRTVAHLLRTESTWIIPVQDTEKILADLGHPNPRLGTDYQIVSLQPACRTAPTLEPATPASHSQSDQTPRESAPATPSRPHDCRSCIPPIRPGTRTTPTTLIQDSGALTTTAHSGRHVANRSL